MIVDLWKDHAWLLSFKKKGGGIFVYKPLASLSLSLM